MNAEEAMGILEAQGFEFESPNVDDFPAIFLFGERVGTLYDDEVYLAEGIPSLPYWSTSKRCIEFTESEKEAKLQVAIDKLKNSLMEYDSVKRKQRVSRVQQYFQKRNEDNKLLEKMKDIQRQG